jgi:hypothetical protein
MNGTQRKRSRALGAVSCLLIASPLTGCASFAGYMGIIVSNLKFPVTWEMKEKSPVNKPLEVDVQEALLHRARLLVDGADLGELSGAFQCEAGNGDEAECLDPVHDPAAEIDHTTVLVAISGGGSRAAVFAAYAMSLIEADYNRVAARFAPDVAPPMVDLIDAFSTVSGGSVYAFHVARRLTNALDASRGLALVEKFEETQDQLIERMSKEQVGQCPLPPEMQRWNEDRRRRYIQLCRTVEDRLPMRKLGTAAFQSTFGYFGLGVPVAIFTDRSYVDHLARGLEFYEPFSMWKVWAPLVNPFLANPDFLQLGDMPVRPRFFFNATALETGAPFVLTRNLMNLPAGKLPRRSTRLDIPTAQNQADDFRPLRHSLTLEEIGSSPGRFPLAYAAAASAAFPAGVEPLQVRRYDYREGLHRFMPSDAKLSLADGGIFDNSGMMTAADFFEHLAERRGVHQLVLITINADATEYDLAFKERSFEPQESNSIRGRFPFSFLSPTAESLNLIHFINKRRGEEIAWRQLVGLQAQIQKRETEANLRAALEARGQAWQDYHDALGPLAPRVVEELEKGDTLSILTYNEVQNLLGPAKDIVHYFPIGLSQLSRDDQDPISEGDSLFRLVRQIGTSFWLSESEEVLLEQAASMIARTEQHSGWQVGPNCPGAEGPSEVGRLGEAVAFALLRAGRDTWDDPINAASGSEWCPR